MVCLHLTEAAQAASAATIGLTLAAIATVSCIVFVCLYRQKLTHVKILTSKSATLESELIEKDNTISRLQKMANEMKTPISLVSNPIRDVLGSADIMDSVRKKLVLASQQADRLSLIVSMTLDETGTLKGADFRNTEKTALNQWLDTVLEDFRFKFSNAGTCFSFRPDPSVGDVIIDRNSVEESMKMLLESTLARTCGRNVSISTSECDGYCRICLWDDGKCIDSTAYGKLAQARILLDISGIKVTFSASDQGNYAMLDIPELVQTDREVVDSVMNSYDRNFDLTDVFDTRKCVLLVADDEDDLLDYVKEEYSGLFRKVLTTRDGKQALAMARSEIPDIIVSDIFMPQMNGFMLCKCIKNDISLSHIPVILLTSRGNPDNQDIGYKLGADDFVPKPFDKNVMYKRISSILRSRFEIKKQYAGNCFYRMDKDQTFSMADETFIVKLNGFITEHIADRNLDIEQIETYMHLSRTNIYNKMGSILGTTPSRYIRGIRLEMAKKLLSDTDLSVGKIADSTGFASLQYFSTAFRDETGMSPREYRNRLIARG